MKKILIIFLINLFATIRLLAQPGTLIPPAEIKGKDNTVAVGATIPISEFSQTHIAGIGIDYSWTKHRFGKMSHSPKKWIGFIANGGADYYFGKRETVAGFNYKYGGYTFLHALGGGIYNFHYKNRLRDFPGLRNIILIAGPAMGIYKGGSDVGFEMNISSSYGINEKIGIVPAILFIKHAQADVLWAITIKVAYSF